MQINHKTINSSLLQEKPKTDPKTNNLYLSITGKKPIATPKCSIIMV